MNAKEINKISIKKYLAELNVHPAKDRGYYGLYHSPFRDDHNASMKVDFEKNLWMDYGAGFGGTLIDLIMQMEKCDAGKAISLFQQKEVINKSENFSFHGRNIIKPEQKSAFIIQNIQEIKNPALIDYLLERGINVNIAKQHCQEISYLVDGKYYFAVGFQNDIHGYELRNKYFKGCTSKAPSYNDVGSNICKVFEGFTDYLSYLTLKKTFYLEQNVVVLNSVSNIEKTKPFIASHEKVIAYLDNDEAGHKATSYLRSFCKNLIDESTHYQNYNDLNDYLKSNQKNTPKNELDNDLKSEQANSYRRKR
ncbi:toprim domain-containing protein [Epilithonimonas vandammei]|uniref:toprim domain-containing protein n=1 Tax=Epilithonimonas vandammei TaxID=2487072 RepID=UPI0028A262E1|nr:toprim domain-containing protein [Epilithonimonas vandammei]